MNPGHTNTRSLLEECADAIFLSRSPAAEAQAEAVLMVLRRRGLLNLQGVEIVTQELGPLPWVPSTPSD